MKQDRTSPRADEDIFETAAYIGRDSVRAAERFIDRLRRRFQSLAENPQIGRKRDEFGAGLRSVSLGTYLIFYREIADGIEIARVVSGYRDRKAFFGH